MAKKRKKGYAYKKAIQILAYEQGKSPLPSLPKSPSIRGAIQSWKKKIEKGYRPRSNETKKVYFNELRKNNISKERPFLRVQGQIHSKRPGNNIQDVIYGFYIAEGQPNRYNDLMDFGEDEIEDLYEVADKLNESNDVDKWNKEFQKLGLDVEVWTLPWIDLI